MKTHNLDCFRAHKFVLLSFNIIFILLRSSQRGFLPRYGKKVLSDIALNYFKRLADAQLAYRNFVSSLKAINSLTKTIQKILVISLNWAWSFVSSIEFSEE